LEPTWAEAWYKLSMMHGSLKDFEKAIEAARKAVSLAPGHAEAHTYLGMTLGETGHLPESVKAFSEALRIKPGHAMAHYGLGVSRFLMKDFSGAEEEHRILLKMNPTLAQRMERLMGGKKE
jgi:tetratricopeptide (TPR) repeat protein